NGESLLHLAARRPVHQFENILLQRPRNQPVHILGGNRSPIPCVKGQLGALVVKEAQVAADLPDQPADRFRLGICAMTPKPVEHPFFQFPSFQRITANRPDRPFQFLDGLFPVVQFLLRNKQHQDRRGQGLIRITEKFLQAMIHLLLRLGRRKKPGVPADHDPPPAEEGGRFRLPDQLLHRHFVQVHDHFVEGGIPSLQNPLLDRIADLFHQEGLPAVQQIDGRQGSPLDFPHQSVHHPPSPRPRSSPCSCSCCSSCTCCSPCPFSSCFFISSCSSSSSRFASTSMIRTSCAPLSGGAISTRREVGETHWMEEALPFFQGFERNFSFPSAVRTTTRFPSTSARNRPSGDQAEGARVSFSGALMVMFSEGEEASSFFSE